MGKVLYSSCSLCHVLTINISPRGKWWGKPCAAMVKKSKWRKQNVSLLIHNHRLDVKSFWFLLDQSGREISACTLHPKKEVVKLYYACDYYHYVSWATVHLYDLVDLPSTNPTCTNVFHNGSFAFQSHTENFHWWGLTWLMSRITQS